MMTNTSAVTPMISISGTVSNAPTPRVMTVRTISARKAMETVMAKLSASFAWSLTKGMVSFFISQMTSGPMKKPMLPAQPDVRMPPRSADRWANIAHCRSSALEAPAGAAGGATASFGLRFSMRSPFVWSWYQARAAGDVLRFPHHCPSRRSARTERLRGPGVMTGRDPEDHPEAAHSSRNGVGRDHVDLLCSDPCEGCERCPHVVRALHEECAPGATEGPALPSRDSLQASEIVGHQVDLRRAASLGKSGKREQVHVRVPQHRQYACRLSGPVRCLDVRVVHLSDLRCHGTLP